MCMIVPVDCLEHMLNKTKQKITIILKKKKTNKQKRTRGTDRAEWAVGARARHAIRAGAAKLQRGQPHLANPPVAGVGDQQVATRVGDHGVGVVEEAR